ncbi:transcription initiation factor TFIID subunit A-domain-containing protein [Gorgonomyces haynaldii]|nr:transcription initiation factor TFIID subunit A-domain-containing protein [Gorgonomyces haynaldii]
MDKRTRSSARRDDPNSLQAMSEALAQIPNAPQPGHPNYPGFMMQFRHQWMLQQQQQQQRPSRRQTQDQEKTLLPKEQLRIALQHIDPEQRLDPDVEDVLVDLASEFVMNVTEHAIKMARLRESDVLEPVDVTGLLERKYDIRVPGFGDEVEIVKKKKKQEDDYLLKLGNIRQSIAKQMVQKKTKKRK